MAEGLEIIVRSGDTCTETALLMDGRLWEYNRCENTGSSLVGSILLGRVERVLPDVKAAFVNIGRKLNGFLPIQESDSFHAVNGKAPLITGNDVVVQVKKDEKGGKGAFLTRDITLPGQYLLLLPMSRFVGVSKRIEDASDHAAAKELGRQIAGDRFGVIVRHAALRARYDAVAREAEELFTRWQQAVAYVSTIKAPAVLMEDRPFFEMLARDYSARYQVRLSLPVCGGERATIPENCEAVLCSETELEARWQGSHVERQLKEALARRVLLPGGASLVIDEREALHTIDVNTGGNVSAHEGKSLALTQNLAAIPEIARQIRLRNLSGIILIDFIDMDASEQAQLAAALEEALSADRIKIVLHGFTSLGLMELTRKRTGSSLREMLCTPCSRCGGAGFTE